MVVRIFILGDERIEICEYGAECFINDEPVRTCCVEDFEETCKMLLECGWLELFTEDDIHFMETIAMLDYLTSL